MLCMPLARTAQAQSSGAASKVLTLEEAIDFALKHYPSVRASLERVNAAQAGVGLARTNYLPRADMVWQTNRATDNNITGLLLPQSIIASDFWARYDVAVESKRVGKCGGIAVLLGTLRFWIPGSKSRRGARHSGSSHGRRFSDTSRCGGRNSKRLPYGAGDAPDGAGGRGGCATTRHVRQGCPCAGR